MTHLPADAHRHLEGSTMGLAEPSDSPMLAPGREAAHVDRAGWLADKLHNGGDYGKEAAALLVKQAAEIARLRAELAGREGCLLPATAFDAGAGVRIERAMQIVGPPLWAVRSGGNVLNKQGEWEWEPLPSSRDDEFLARARYATPADALSALSAYRAAESKGTT